MNPNVGECVDCGTEIPLIDSHCPECWESSGNAAEERAEKEQLAHAMEARCPKHGEANQPDGGCSMCDRARTSGAR